MATAVGPNIVTDGLIYAIDAGSTRSYPGSGATVDDLVGATSGSLINGVTYSSNNAGKWEFDGVDQSLNIDLIELGNFTISQFIKFPTGQRITQPLHKQVRAPQPSKLKPKTIKPLKKFPRAKKKR